MPGSLAAAALSLMAGIYSIGYAFELLSPTFSAKMSWVKVEYLGVATLPSIWLLFVSRYTGMDRWLSRRNLVFVAAEPVLTILLAWTNDFHHLVWKEVALTTGRLPALSMTYGSWLYAHVIYSTIAIWISIYFLLLHMTNRYMPDLYRRQVAALIVSALLPMSGGIARAIGIGPENLDLVPFTFVLTGLTMTWALSRHHLFLVMPVAQDTIIKNMSDGVVVLNVINHVVGINRAMERLIGRQADDVVGMPVAEAFAAWPELIAVSSGSGERQTEIIRETEEGYWVFDTHISPLYDRWGGVTGQLIVLRDITARKQAEEMIARERTAYRIISEAAVEDTDISEMCRRVLNGLIEALPFDFGTVRLCDKGGGLLYPVAVFGLKDEEIRKRIPAQPVNAADYYVGALVAQNREAIFAPDVKRHPIYATHRRRLEELEVGGLIGCPLFSTDGSLLGVLQLLSHRPLRIREDDRIFFTTVAQMFSLVLERRLAAARLEAQKRLFESLVAVARAATERPTPEDVLRNVLEVVISLTNAEHGSLFLMDGEVVTKAILARGTTSPRQERELVGKVMSDGLAGLVVRGREPVVIEDTAQDKRWISLPNEPYKVRSALAVPILSEGTVVGVLTLSHSEPGHFDAEQVALMRAAADQMALALRNAQIFEAQRRLADRQITLYEVLRTVGGHLDPRTAARVAVDTLATLTGWNAVAVLLPNEWGNYLVVEAASGAVAGVQGRLIPIEQGVTGRAFRTGETQYVPDVSEDPDYIVGHHSIRCELAVPLRHGGRVLGVLNIESDRVDDMDATDIQMAESLADALALAVDNARLFQEVTVERGRLEALIESARDGVVLVGMNRRVLVINAAGLDALGLPGEPDDWVNRPLRDAIAIMRQHLPDVVRSLFSEMRRVQDGDEPAGEGEYTFGHRIIHWSNLPVLAGETPLGRLVVLRDVTEERLLEQMRDDLTHTLVHDLRNPLTAISASLQFLRMAADALPSETRRMLDIAEHNTQRMIDLVNAILDVTRLENGSMPVEREPLPLAVLVSEVLEAQIPLAQERGLRVVDDVPNDLPLVFVDGRLIRRVLQNLVGNAVKFTPDGGEIRVTARTEEHQVLVSVSDTGPGIPPELRERLFQKFATGRHERRGSGLGLVFCKMAVEAHGGRIWLEDVPEGTTFTFSLPTFSGGASSAR